MNNYTYPILLENDSSYKNECRFSLEKIKHQFDEENMIIEFDCIMESKFLKKLIDEQKAYVLVTASSMMKKIVKKYDSFTDKIKIEVPLDILTDYDNVALEAFILVKKEFELSYNEEMEDEYIHFRKKLMKPNMQLAISNKIILYYRTCENSFISLSKSDDLNGLGLRVDSSNPDAIYVKAGTEFCDAFNAVSNDNEVASELLNCMIAFIGIYQTALEIKEDDSMLDKIKEYKWYDRFEYLFAQKEIDIIDFFENDADTVQDLFVNIQNIIGNELENTLIRCRRITKGFSGGEKND